MISLRTVLLRLRSLFSKERLEDEMSEEMRFHLENLIADNIKAGMNPVDARFAALRDFGGVDQIKEQCRDTRGTRFLEEFCQDVKYGARSLRRAPGFAAAAVLSLALGVGANTAIFTLINALMLRTLPVERPEELVILKKVGPQRADETFSYQAFTMFRDDAPGFAGALAATNARKNQITVNDETESVYTKLVSGNYFSVLGVGAFLGRTLSPEDDRLPTGQPVAVISYGFWRRRFVRDAGVLGRTFTAKGNILFTIVGVAPPQFYGEAVGEAPDIWTPLTVQPLAPAWLWNGHSTTWLRIVARRNPGMTIEQAKARLEPVFDRMQSDIVAGMETPRFRRQILEQRLGVEDGSHGISALRERFSLPLRILMVVVGLVLLIACANVANLLLARAAARQREIAVRLAIGAGRFRLVRQLLTEALLLASLGGGLGFVVARWGSKVLVALASRASDPIPIDLGPDVRVIAFTGALALLTGLLFGLAPALRATRVDLTPALNDAGGLAWPGRRIPLDKVLVVAQVAISLFLLIGAGLFVRSLKNLNGINTGFEAENVVVFQIDPSATGYKGSQKTNLYQQLIERAESIPGVVGASLAAGGLFTRNLWGNVLTIEGYVPAAGETVHSLANAVSPRYFEVMGIRLLRGRDFDPGDRENAPRVAVVNQTFARQYFGDADPLGRRVGFGAPAKEMVEIVGIVKDAKYEHLRETARPMIYVPFLQNQVNLSELEVRTAARPASLAAVVRREVAAVDRSLPVLDAATLREQVNASIVAERLIARLSGAFGVLALLLASIGLFGVMAHTVVRRRREVGIRMALGADPGKILALVMSESIRLVFAGIALALPAALAGGRLISRQLYGLSPSDPLTITVATVILAAAALAAGYFPARRAAKVDPMVVLRNE